GPPSIIGGSWQLGGHGGGELQICLHEKAARENVTAGKMIGEQHCRSGDLKLGSDPLAGFMARAFERKVGHAAEATWRDATTAKQGEAFTHALRFVEIN